MRRAAAAGSVYFAAVFALGFVLGALRVTLLAPRVGELASVALELPIMLAAAWLICRAVLERFAVPPRARERLAMGVCALALLLAAEALLSLAFGGTLGDFLADLARAPGALGLAGQAVFAAFPLAQR